MGIISNRPVESDVQKAEKKHTAQGQPLAQLLSSTCVVFFHTEAFRNWSVCWKNRRETSRRSLAKPLFFFLEDVSICFKNITTPLDRSINLTFFFFWEGKTIPTSRTVVPSCRTQIPQIPFRGKTWSLLSFRPEVFGPLKRSHGDDLHSPFLRVSP